MQGLRQLILILLLTGLPALAQSAENPAVFAGQDLYLSANNLVSNPNTAAERCLVFNDNFSLAIDGLSFT